VRSRREEGEEGGRGVGEGRRSGNSSRQQ